MINHIDFTRTSSLYQLTARQAYISCITDSNSVTVTVAAYDTDAFTASASSRGLWVKPVHLKGRFHHSAHQQSVDSIKALCKLDSRFRLPNANSLRLPLRSNADGTLLHKESLHDVALSSILTEQSQWLRTVAAAVTSTPVSKEDILPIGKGAFIPSSIDLKPVSRPVSPHESSDYTSETDSSTPTSKRSSQSISDASLSSARSRTSPIAVVGMACRFPEADTLEEYWKLIDSGGCAVREVPPDRFKPSDLSRNPKGPFYGNFIRNPDAFDNKFFGISSREAKSMDPQQRLLLQVAYESMESSGYFGHDTKDRPSNIGCYVGVGSVDYDHNVASHDAGAFSASGTLRAFISGKVSHYFGWNGPSITYDTACSSSAVAIHSACQALKANECAVAVAGGVNVITSPALYQNLAAASFLNPDGASRAFDADANGYCRGEGAGLVVLKPLARAIEDGNSILGVIGGTAVNQGSNHTPITVPASASQSELYKQTLHGSGVGFMDVSYVEAHGTGTPVGDPIECESIRRVFGGSRRAQKLFIGSVKDNIGHTEAASGVAALIKTLLMIQHHKIPKQANFTTLNPSIASLEPDRMAIAKQSQPWKSNKLIAVVNNYGAGGSNAALLVQENESSNRISNARVSTRRSVEYPFYISAKTSEGLLAYLESLRSLVERMSKPDGSHLLSDLAYNLATKQNRALEQSLTFMASSVEALSCQLANDSPNAGRVVTVHEAPPVVLCFGGQSGKTAHISKELFDGSKILQHHLTACELICQALGLPSLFPGLFDSSEVEDTVQLHCRLFTIQYACARTWLDCGLTVDTLIGHSFGQLTALCVAESISLSDGMYLVSERARLVRDHWANENGVMLSIEGARDATNDLLQSAKQSCPARVADIACYNSQKNIVVAGTEESIKAVEEASKFMEAAPKLARLNNTNAYHSHLTDAILPGLTEVAKAIDINKPSMRIETCSVGESWSRYTADEIVQHTRNPVFFSEAVERINRRLGSAVWLEAGTGSPIIPMTRRVLSSYDCSNHEFQPMHLGGEDAQSNLAKATNGLWMAGCNVTFWPFHESQKGQYRWINLPPYAFEKSRHWLEYKASPVMVADTKETESDGPRELVSLINKQANLNGEMLFSVDTTNDTFKSCTTGHAVCGQSLCPASMYFEFATRAIRKATGADSFKTFTRIKDLNITSPLSLSPAGTVFLSLRQGGSQDLAWKFSLFSRQSTEFKDTIHATGAIALLNSHDDDVSRRFQSMKRLVGPARCHHIANSPNANGLSGTAVYKMFDRVVKYATYFRGVRRLDADGFEAVGQVIVPDDQPQNYERGWIAPLAVDNFLQVAGIHVNCLSESKADEVFMCTAIGELLISERFMEDCSAKRSWTVYTNYEHTSKNRASNDIFVFDAEGQIVLVFMRAQFTAVPFKSLSRTLSGLSGLRNSGISTGEKENSDAKALDEDTLDHVDGVENVDKSVAPPNDQTTAPNSPLLNQTLVKVQEMLCEVLEVPLKEVQPESILADLGVDSLMTTEVLGDIRKRFDVTVSTSEFSTIIDIKSLCLFLDPLSFTKAGTETLSVARRQVDTQSSTSIEVDTQNANLTHVIGDSFGKIKASYELVAEETKFKGFCDSVYPAQAELVVSYVLEAFSLLGSPVSLLRPGQQLPSFKYAPKHKQVVSQLYNILEDARLVVREEEAFYRTDTKCPHAPSQELHSSLLERYPQHAFEHKLLGSTGPKLAECLNEAANPISLLFGNAEARQLMADVYTHAPMFKTGTIVLAKYLVSIFNEANPAREIRILELGAGTGGTTKYLIDQLVQCENQKFQYTFTDLSSSMVTAAKKSFQKYDFMRYTVLDIEQTPAEKFLGQYDIIISTNCIHATRDLAQSCTNIRKMLRKDGVLCLVELTQNLFWFDLVFGLLEGWWLFEDGRQHALAKETLWHDRLTQAGFNWVDWTDGTSKESDILRLIAASPSEDVQSADNSSLAAPQDTLSRQETVLMQEIDGTKLYADIHYPARASSSDAALPVVLMIHGGGHVMLSRKDVRPQQTEKLLDAGFLPISVDYRLCPEITLQDGPMRDVCYALSWIRSILPSIQLERKDIRVDGSQVVAVGWSTGGHLAMTLAWTSIAAGIQPPSAILAFYCPTDYEDPFWKRPNLPRGAETEAATLRYDLWEGVCDRPITSYNPPPADRALGGWMAPTDPRSRIALHMNWKGQALHVLLNGLCKAESQAPEKKSANPSVAQIQAVSPLAQIRIGAYRTPTFIVHGTRDDLIPWEQAQRTHLALLDSKVESKLEIVEGAEHLFDIYRGFEKNEQAKKAVSDGYEFLKAHVQLP